jgi:ribonuclease HI
VSRIEIYTDGGCHGNPGPGAWAYVMTTNGEVREQSGSESLTTNNRMELTAVINALREVDRKATVSVHTDSQYVKHGITNWIQRWLSNGWITAARKPVKNKELWIELHELDKMIRPTWEWVRGHSGDRLNERCDTLVQEAIAGIE